MIKIYESLYTLHIIRRKYTSMNIPFLPAHTIKENENRESLTSMEAAGGISVPGVYTP